MRSHFNVPFTKDYKNYRYCYHSVNAITFVLAQNDHIKRLLLQHGFHNNRNEKDEGRQSVTLLSSFGSD